MQFSSEIINIHDDFFSLQFSDGLTLSWHELNTIVVYFSPKKQTEIFVFFLL